MGMSKKEAQQAAAADALSRFSIEGYFHSNDYPGASMAKQKNVWIVQNVVTSR